MIQKVCAPSRCAPAAGDFLFHLGHANGARRQIVGKGRTPIGHETQHRVGMLAQPLEEVECHGRLDPTAALVLPLDRRIARFAPGAKSRRSP